LRESDHRLKRLRIVNEPHCANLVSRVSRAQKTHLGRTVGRHAPLRHATLKDVRPGGREPPANLELPKKVACRSTLAGAGFGLGVDASGGELNHVDSAY
jgi:hypothetical protein